MDVVINGILYKAENNSVIAILSKKDRINIINMENNYRYYGSFPKDVTYASAKEAMNKALELDVLFADKDDE